jgi:hypothetical protein
MYSKAILSLFVLLGGACSAIRESYGTEPGFSLQGTRFTIHQDHDEVVIADQKLAALMKTAEVIPAGLVHEQHLYLLLFVRQPTRALSMHRCGAGAEDRLLLLRASAGKAHVKDVLQLQSCEAGEHLDVDDPESTEDVVNGITLQGNRLSFHVVRSFVNDEPVSRQYRVTNRFEELK